LRQVAAVLVAVAQPVAQAQKIVVAGPHDARRGAAQLKAAVEAKYVARKYFDVDAVAGVVSSFTSTRASSISAVWRSKRSDSAKSWGSSCWPMRNVSTCRTREGAVRR
jgi:hypothetical protein